MSGMIRSQWLSFTPQDTVFVRDGRSFDAAADAVADTVRPGPTTIAGAVGAAFAGNPDEAYGKAGGELTQWDRLPREVRGPVLAYRDKEDGTWTPYFPVPADLVITTNGSRRVYRMTLDDSVEQDAAGVTDLTEASDGLRLLAPPWQAEPAKALTGWIPGTILAGYLAGVLPGPEGMPEHDLRIADPLVPERRVGLARDGRTARAGYLYQATHLRPRDGWGFLAEYDAPGGWQAVASSPCAFGGRGRMADVAPADARWPDAITDDSMGVAASSVGARVLVYLATPAVWPDGWRLPVPPGARLVAAATGEPEPAATVRRDQGQWRASRVLRWAVPAGSVYLLEFADAAEGTAWARTWNGKALDRGVPEQPDLVRTAGYGVVLTGAWT